MKHSVLDNEIEENEEEEEEEEKIEKEDNNALEILK